MWTQILYGAIAGFGLSLTGWAKNKTEFDFMKMVPTLLISTIVGGIAGYTGQDYGFIATGTLGASVSMVITNLWKAIFPNKKKK